MVLKRSSAWEKRGRGLRSKLFHLRPKIAPGVDSATSKTPVLISILPMLTKIENFKIFPRSKWAWPFEHDAPQKCFASWTFFDEKGIKSKLKTSHRLVPTICHYFTKVQLFSVTEPNSEFFQWQFLLGEPLWHDSSHAHQCQFLIIWARGMRTLFHFIFILFHVSDFVSFKKSKVNTAGHGWILLYLLF